MPRDDWARARAKDVARRSTQKLNVRGKTKSARSNKRKKSHHTLDRLRQSTTKFWFGKHNGKTVAEVAKSDPDYIIWLSKQPSNHWRMTTFINHLNDIAHQTGNTVSATV